MVSRNIRVSCITLHTSIYIDSLEGFGGAHGLHYLLSTFCSLLYTLYYLPSFGKYILRPTWREENIPYPSCLAREPFKVTLPGWSHDGHQNTFSRSSPTRPMSKTSSKVQSPRLPRNIPSIPLILNISQGFSTRSSSTATSPPSGPPPSKSSISPYPSSPTRNSKR